MAIKGKQIIEVPERTSLTGEEYIPFQDRSINGRIKSSLLKGLKGDKGDRGEQGIPGSKGDKGEKGEPGINGKDGTTPVITANATISNTSGSPAVKVTKTGNHESPSFLFEFSGLKGEPGKQGTQGIPGVKGDKGEPGTNGKDGKTPAIEATATIANTTGAPSVKVTKSEKADSTSFSFAFSGLKGERGEQGAQGLKGDKGDTGTQGVPGKDGAKGEKGDKGDSGIMSSVLIEGATPTQSISPNKFYKFGSVTTLTITFSPETPNVLNEYMFQFTSGETATVLNMPDSVKWIGDHTIEPNKTYQVSIVNNLAVIGGAS